MRRLPAARPTLVVVALGLTLALGACSSDETTGDAIAVTAGNTDCRVAQTALTAGKHSFRVENTGSQVTEVYVYAPGDKVVAEKEDIGPGTKATFSATLKSGQYEIACKPGQTGSGIRTPITVT